VTGRQVRDRALGGTAERTAGKGGGGTEGEDAGGAGPPGVLYVIATPIGNLGDVTLRALETLGSVPLVAAEDTRITSRLLDRHGIDVRLMSYHARSGSGRLVELLEHLRAGRDLALVTDAGTPVVSDPGGDLVAAWAGEGGRVVPIPGASAVLAAVSAAGIAGPRWSFEGFLPRSGRERRERLEAIGADPRGTVLFEAPTRLAATIGDLVTACGADRPAAICRELTKVHEQIVRGGLDALRTAVGSGAVPARGEIVLVVGMHPEAAGRGHLEAATPAGDRLAAALTEVERLVAAGTARGEAARLVAGRTGIPRRQLYRPATEQA
jgi:16S rRNA (cytidine1402-2'-O)-methyltransferase